MFRRNDRGFTLIEILVVVFIIALVTLATSLTVGTTRGGRVVSQEAQQLQRVIELAAQTAMLEQIELGVGLWKTGYAVWQYDLSSKQWTRVTHDIALKEYTLPSSLTLSLDAQQKPSSLPPTIEGLKTPQLWFSSSGMMTPAIIKVSAGDVVYTVEIKVDGEVLVHEE